MTEETEPLPPETKSEISAVYQLLIDNGPMTYKQIEGALKINYYSIRRFIQVLMEQNRVEQIPSEAREKFYRVTTVEAASYEFPRGIWLDKGFRSIANYAGVIVEFQDPLPYTDTLDEYRKQCQLFVRLLNEALQLYLSKDRIANPELITSCRDQLYDIADKYDRSSKIIRDFLANETLKPGEMFGMFTKDKAFLASIPTIKKAMNIIMGEIVYPDVLPEIPQPNESEDTEV